MKILKAILMSILAAVALLVAVPMGNGYASENGAMGVDVSSWNGAIDWAAAGTQIDFAILRVGSKLSLDGRFEENAAGCKDCDIPFGVYYVSSAASVEDAQAEAALVIDAIQGHALRLPVFFDVEYRLHSSLTSQQLRAVAKAFCDAVLAAGYQPGLYCDVELMETHFSTEEFDALPKWVSQPDTEQCTYSGEFVMWQYSWSGRVAGITGDVDCNFYYDDLSWPSCQHEALRYSFADNVHVFTCDACGEVAFTKESTDGKQFKFNTAAPALSVNIVMNIATTIPTGFSDPYMVIEFNGKTTTLTDYTINATNGRYEYAFPGINPQTMGDTFVATLYAKYEGTDVSVQLEYSMLKYINSQLKKSSTSAALRTALSDLVMYGEANQVYEGYKTDALLSTLLESTATLTPSTFPGLDASYNQQATDGTKDANIDLKGVSMILGSKVMVRMTTFCTDASAYSVKVNIGELEYTYAVSDLKLADGYTDRYVVEFDQIKATQFGDVITFSFVDASGNAVGRTLTYSVYTYVQKNQASTDENLVNLLEAIYNYGEAVKNI